ncbi:hypothetical protein [Enterobacter sp. 22466]|uniref:hypothetical protein n=1 Tax=Enterobacter sp. 22466 TaxID=3453924 RepID=UPI003F8663B4
MPLITYIKAHVFHDLNAAIKLANKDPSPKNVKLLQKLSGVKNISVNITKKGGDIAYQTQKDLLIGKSIAPNIASIKSDKVVFNGYGEIISLQAPLKKRDFKVLINNMVKPLKETPVKNTEGKIRTAAECAIDMGCAIKNSDIQSDVKSLMLNEIKNVYLSSSLSRQTLDLFLNYSSQVLGGNFPVINKLKTLLNSVEKDFYLTKHNDNYYGRTFESTIAEMIVSKPSNEMNKNVEIIKNKMINDFNSLGNSQKQDLIESINSQMKADPAIWRADIPEATKFLDECTSDNFIKMMSTSSKMKHLLIMHLAVKYVITSPGFEEMKNTASALYIDVISPQRDLNRVLNSQEVSNRTGIKLNYQMQGKAGQPGYTGVRPMDRYKSSIDTLTEHNQEALTFERPIGIGMSGSSNILNHLFISLDDESFDFNIAHARLLAASFLTYSGGHSINEAYTVFGYKDNKSFKPVSYSTLSESDDFTKNIIDTSYNKLIDEAIILN